jgi:hypothetical protein
MRLALREVVRQRTRLTDLADRSYVRDSPEADRLSHLRKLGLRDEAAAPFRVRKQGMDMELACLRDL